MIRYPQLVINAAETDEIIKKTEQREGGQRLSLKALKISELRKMPL